MLGGKKMEGLECESNPTWMEIGGRRLVGLAIATDSSFLGTGGQTVDDIFKYIPGDSRLAMAQRTLEWRHLAPTAPDTLCTCWR
jgi:DNA polymerase delta subunit 2